MEIRRPDPTTDLDEVLSLVQACDRAVYDDSAVNRPRRREDDTVGGVGVDAESTTGAVALSERVGMHVVRRSDSWEWTA